LLVNSPGRPVDNFPTTARTRSGVPGRTFGFLALLGYHSVLEVELFFQELLPRLTHIELAAEPEWVQATFVGGLKSMPVRYTFESNV